jgi:adenylate cyclase
VPLVLLTLLCLAAGLAARFDDPAPLRQLRDIAFDSYQRLDPRPYDRDAPVRVVTIDEDSLRRIGQWPWPRSTMADLVDRLAAHGAAAIAFDMIFSEPDRMSPEVIAGLFPKGGPRDALLASLSERPSNDALFAEALGAAPTVLGVVGTPAVETPEERAADLAFAAPKTGFAFAGDDPTTFLPGYTALTAPLPSLSQLTTGLGALNWVPDRDQVVRSVPLLVHVDGLGTVPTLATEALRVAQGASTLVVRSSNASGETAFGASTGVNAVRIGALTVPTDASGGVRVHFSETTPHRHIPAWWVLEGQVDPAEVAGRIILVGATATGLYDIQATPLDPALPGVDIHAQLIEHILAGENLVRPDWAAGLEILVFAVLTIVFALAAGILSPLGSIALGVLLLAGVFAGSYGLFLEHRLLVDPTFPALASGVALLAATSFAAVRERLDRQWVRSAFGRYVAKELVESLASDPTRLELGGEIRPMTILFTDMRNFTTLSEGMDARTLTTFVNAFLTPLTDAVLARRGTVDKYIGDAVMAFWNAPLDDARHVENACAAALDMLAAIERFNIDHPERPIAIGIGINTGECCVGNLGSSRRFDYSVIGDPVNVASRLEGQTKEVGVPILLGPETARAAAAAGFLTLHVDSIRMKGKTEPTDAFALLAGPDHPLPAAHAAAVEVLASALDAVRRGDGEAAFKALAGFDQDAAPGLIPLAERTRARAERLAPPLAEAAE